MRRTTKTQNDGRRDYQIYDQSFSPEWDNYMKYRPAYPDVLFENYIFPYHDRRCSDTSLAVDFGCGAGALEPWLLKHFESVVATDLNEAQLKIAAYRIKEEQRVSFKLHDANDRLDALADGSVSMVIAGTAVPWFDADGWLAEAGRVLRPTGTLAFFSYGDPMITTNAEAHRVFKDFLRDKVLAGLRPALGEEGWKRQWRFEAGALHVHLPSEFDNEVRILFDSGAPAGSTFLHDDLVDSDFAPTSALVQHLPLLMWQKGWTVDDFEASLRTLGKAWTPHEATADWLETKDRIKALTGNQMDIAYQLNLCMATRR